MKDRKTASPREAYGKALVELGKELPNLVVLDADLSCSTKTCDFARAYPKRFINAGVAEQDMMGLAAGLASTGKIVFASTFAAFASGRAWEQVRVSIAYPRLNVKIVATHGGIITGEDGATHQATEDIAIMRVIPNLTVIVPADSLETEKAVKTAAKMFGPVYIRLPRSNVPFVHEKDIDYKIGVAQTLREGRDLSIIAAGIMTVHALDAAEELAKDGISARVVNMHTIKPLDRDAIMKAGHETGAIVTAEEHSILGGLGSAVAEVLVENHFVPMARVGIKDMFAESGKPDDLLEKYELTSKSIIKAARDVLKRKAAS